MKRKRLLLILLALFFCFTGCDTYDMVDQYPWDRADQWYCEEIDFTITFQRDLNGNFISSPPSRLIWDEQTYDLYVGFHASDFSFGIEIEPGMCEDCVRGSWKYQGDKLVLSISEDLIFNGAFAELIFVPLG